MAGTKMTLWRFGGLAIGGNFGVVKVGEVLVEADQQQDTLELTGDLGIELTPDEATKLVNFKVTEIDGGTF